MIETAINAAIEAGKAILKIYGKAALEVELKEDQSPLTLADKDSHAVIKDMLKKTGYPVLSEEGVPVPYEERKQWEYYWLVDPLDGTKEFIKRNGDFTVNIALIHKNRPSLGVVYVPVTKELYYASDKGSWKAVFDPLIDRLREPLALSNRSFHKGGSIKIVASKSHLNEDTANFIRTLEKQFVRIEILSRGSSLKFCMMAEGLADIYPRFGPTMEWDTAAGHAIAMHAGLEVLQAENGRELTYNKENLLNPCFIVKLKNFDMIPLNNME